MDNITGQKEKLSLPENIGQILFDILREYKLEETDDETFAKIESDQPFSSEIIMDAVGDLLFGRTQEKDLPVLLQQKLNISQSTAENLFASIKTNIIPLIKKVPDDDVGEEKKLSTEQSIPAETSMPIIKPPIGVTEALNQKNKVVPPTKKIEPVKKSIPPKIKMTPKIEVSKKPTQSDSYREPIE